MEEHRVRLFPEGQEAADPPRILARRVRVSEYNCTSRGEVVSLLIIARQDSSVIIDARG